MAIQALNGVSGRAGGGDAGFFPPGAVGGDVFYYLSLPPPAEDRDAVTGLSLGFEGLARESLLARSHYPVD